MIDPREYRQLLIFTLAVEGGTVNYAAARIIESSVAEVSTELHRIEFLGGRRLFQLADNRLELTPEGQSLYSRLQPVFGEFTRHTP